MTRCARVLLGTLALTAACGETPPDDRVRVSGYVEATDVRVAAEAAGRVVDLAIAEGARVAAGDVIARLDTTGAELALERAAAERAAVEAQLRLLQAGARREDVEQARAQVSTAQADAAAAQVELRNARLDLERFESLLRAESGSRKQRDDAAARVELAEERGRAATQRVEAAQAALARLRAGARPQEIDAARARVTAVDAQINAIKEDLADATVLAPAAGIVTERLVERGELVGRGSPIAVITDLDRAWANVFVDEPMVPRLRLGQPATVYTDAGGEGLPGTLTFISPRAEFTPRNVQTAEERSKLVYRVKVGVDNSQGILKQGMPVEVVLPLREPSPGAPR
jgi:HlyD family secretion protein